MQHSPFLRPGQPARLRFAAALSLLSLLFSGALGACSEEEVPFCFGGFITADGTCEGKCTPESCLEGNTCVNNRCVLECAAHTDCLADGTQDCAPAVEDDTKREILACQGNNKPYGFTFKCPFGNECSQILSCPETGTPCFLDQCNGVPDACVLDTDYCYGRANCLVGKCPDKKPCTVLTCAASECKAPLSCLSTAVGDANAFCTKQDCQSDAECPGGFYCGTTREARALCGSMNPAKGNNGLCGESDEACIESSSLGMGNTMFEGQLCVLRKTCIQRDTCAPCASDLDCSQIPNSHCITLPNDTTKRCAAECVKDSDCGRAYACQPVDATAPEGPKACFHRFGSCVGDGNYCEPCVNDEDCGSLTGLSVCIQATDGSRGCADLGTSGGPCTSNADCPLSPSGKRAECDLNMNSPNYQTCQLLPYTLANPSNPDQGGEASCW